MAQWKIQEFANLTHVTIRTLHHYDKIGLLRPMLRQDNGYRIYTQQDLEKLQQILALKFFGFDLVQIQQLLKKHQSLMDSFTMQAQLLAEKIKILTQAQIALQQIIQSEQGNHSIAWENILQSMKVYKTMENLEQCWAIKILDQQELQDYAILAEELEKRYGKDFGQLIGLRWQQVVDKVKQHIMENPLSSIGKDVAADCVQFVHDIYGKKYAYLSRIIWEKGFKGNKIDDPHAMTPEMVSWLDQAIDGYYGQEIQKLLLSIQDTVTPQTKTAWKDLMDEMCGANPDITKREIINQALFINDQFPADQQMSSAAVTWLKSLV